MRETYSSLASSTASYFEDMFNDGETIYCGRRSTSDKLRSAFLASLMGLSVIVMAGPSEVTKDAGSADTSAYNSTNTTPTNSTETASAEEVREEFNLNPRRSFLEQG